jgi:hypothetical protein
VVVERSIPSVSLNAKALLCLAFLVLLLVPLDTHPVDGVFVGQVDLVLQSAACLRHRRVPQSSVLFAPLPQSTICREETRERDGQRERERERERER